MRAMMKTHLDQTMNEAVDQLTAEPAFACTTPSSSHIVDMADTLSSGIVKQFPSRFR